MFPRKRLRRCKKRCPIAVLLQRTFESKNVSNGKAGNTRESHEQSRRSVPIDPQRRMTTGANLMGANLMGREEIRRFLSNQESIQNYFHADRIHDSDRLRRFISSARDLMNDSGFRCLTQKTSIPIRIQRGGKVPLMPNTCHRPRATPRTSHRKTCEIRFARFGP
jgi:hypothetical protein